ncbi:MAG: AcrR family transcriptional regulator [Bradymonadia bacterium]|jgi:AcrR family transcriptional regulator
MPLPRFSRLDPDERHRILAGAADEFGKDGFAKASLNRIIKTIGLSKGAMYYYFDGKGDLYGAVIDHAVQLFVANHHSFDVDDVTPDRYWAQLEEVARANLRFLDAHPWVAGIARTISTALPDTPGGRLNETIRRWTERYLVRGQEIGIVREDLPLDLLVNAVIASGEAVDRWMLDHWEEEPDEVDSLVPLALDLLKRLVEPGPTRALEEN